MDCPGRGAGGGGEENRVFEDTIGCVTNDFVALPNSVDWTIEVVEESTVVALVTVAAPVVGRGLGGGGILVLRNTSV